MTARRKPAPRPRQGSTARVFAKSVEKRQRVLDAAARVLARRGYAETTIAEIAAEIGAHAGSIYYYFPSREGLVREVLLTSLDRMLGLLRGALEGSPDKRPIERLEDAIRIVMRLNTSAHDDYSKAYIRSFNQVPEALAKEFNGKRQETREAWSRLLAEARAAGELGEGVNTDLASLLIMGASSWVPTWYVPGGTLSSDEVSEAFVAMLLRGLAAPEA